jgi:HK97 gp10 family phage protein
MAENEFSLRVTEPNGGLATVIERIKDFSEKMQKKAVRAAARKAMVPVREAARAKAKTIDDPATTDVQIWKNIVINESARGGRRVGGIVMRVGVRGGALSKVERELAGGAGYRYNKETKKYVQVKRFGKVKKLVVHPGGVTAPHWRFVELGTKKMPARPFMRPALEENIGRVIDEFAKELDVQIKKQLQYRV